MGRRNDLPAFFERIHPVTSVPRLGILFTSGVVLAITLLGSFEFVVRSATFTILLYYSITNLAAIKQPLTQQLYSRPIPWLGLAGCLVNQLNKAHEDVEVRIFLMADAAACAVVGQNTPNGYYNIE